MPSSRSDLEDGNGEHRARPPSPWLPAANAGDTQVVPGDYHRSARTRQPARRLELR
ncbi:MAG: hypothetical protein U5Q44_06360 [Dehalococcoidia bacterium]|nr:hypothetical protein [Dehalococcoidia bacterium]